MNIRIMDITRLDLNLLLTFDALFETRRVSLAAQRLKVSQPTVSFSLKKLRDFFADDLFVRTSTGMKPTPYAVQLQTPVRSVIEIVSQEVLKKPGFEARSAERRFTVSTSDIGELVFLPSLLKALIVSAPLASLRSVALSHRELPKALEDGEIDLALGYFPDLTVTGIKSQTLFEHPFTCLVRKDHPAVGEHLTLGQFMALDHLVVSQEGRSQEIFEKTMTELGLQRRILLHLPHFMSVPYMIAATDMISTVPLAVGRAFAGWSDVRLVKPPIEIPKIPLRQYWHRRSHNDPAVTWFRGIVADSLLDRDPSETCGSLIFASAQQPSRASIERKSTAAH